MPVLFEHTSYLRYVLPTEPDDNLTLTLTNLASDCFYWLQTKTDRQRWIGRQLGYTSVNWHRDCNRQLNNPQAESSPTSGATSQAAFGGLVWIERDRQEMDGLRGPMSWAGTGEKRAGNRRIIRRGGEWR